MITNQQIESCGWEPQVIRIDKGILDDVYEHPIIAEEDGDILIQGWSITKNDKEWWEMCRNNRRLLVVHKWYRNEVGQEWDVVMDILIDDTDELLGEMKWLKIIK